MLRYCEWNNVKSSRHTIKREFESFFCLYYTLSCLGKGFEFDIQRYFQVFALLAKLFDDLEAAQAVWRCSVQIIIFLISDTGSSLSGRHEQAFRTRRRVKRCYATYHLRRLGCPCAEVRFHPLAGRFRIEEHSLPHKSTLEAS